MGINVLARNRGIPSLFITNQFRPRLWASRFYFYPGLEFVSRQIAKAARILVADSPPPYTMCEFNLNLTAEAARKTTYVGHFARGQDRRPLPPLGLGEADRGVRLWVLDEDGQRLHQRRHRAPVRGGLCPYARRAAHSIARPPGPLHRLGAGPRREAVHHTRGPRQRRWTGSR